MLREKLTDEEEEDIKQMSKANWLKVEDSNSKFCSMDTKIKKS